MSSSRNPWDDLRHSVEQNVRTMSFGSNERQQKYVRQHVFEVLRDLQRVWKLDKRDSTRSQTQVERVQLRDAVLRRDFKRLFVLAIYTNTPLKMLNILLHRGFSDDDLPFTKLDRGPTRGRDSQVHRLGSREG
ncbi:hypothetical protein DPSP01_012478 [Paraphaeosphaeria sporulosa]